MSAPDRGETADATEPRPTGGLLSVVSTPIGNLEDVTLRCLRTLREADVVLAEDTRRTRKLCSHHGIDTPLRAFHAHSGGHALQQALDALAQGKHVAIVTDAGTPVVSDPGLDLVTAARDADISVEVVPGASALTAAVAVAGIPLSALRFVGFLPRSGRRRREALDTLVERPEATVLFESPHRLAATLGELATLLGDDRRIAVCRELTKLHEEVARGTATELAERFRDGTRGELTLVIQGRRPEHDDADPDALDEAIHDGLRGGDTPRDLAKTLAERLGLPKRQVYTRIQQLADSDGDDGDGDDDDDQA